MSERGQAFAQHWIDTVYLPKLREGFKGPYYVGRVGYAPLRTGMSQEIAEKVAAKHKLENPQNDYEIGIAQ